jgi:predicted P-loop ATPase
MRDQLFAEGLMAVRRGDRYWPVDGELDALAQVVEKRRIRDSWEDAIEDWAIKSYQGGPLSSHYLLSCVLGVDRATRSDDLRLAQVVQRLGFVREGAKWLPGPSTITRRLAVVPAA